MPVCVLQQHFNLCPQKVILIIWFSHFPERTQRFSATKFIALIFQIWHKNKFTLIRQDFCAFLKFPGDDALWHYDIQLFLV